VSANLTGSIGASAVTQIPPNGWTLGGLYFDAWLRLNHQNSLTITQHPVESGAQITDHSFVNPKRFSFEIGVSNVATSVIATQFQGGASRSVNAYNAILKLQESRQLLTLVSKYGTYENILIESIDAPDDFTTKEALKATINLYQVIIVQTVKVKVSSSVQVTNQTNRGQVGNQTPTESALRSIYKSLGIPQGQVL